jgi:predicted nucleotidyltransferase
MADTAAGAGRRAVLGGMIPSCHYIAAKITMDIDGDEHRHLHQNAVTTMTIALGVILPESEIAAICRRYQVKELALFGSAARGELRPDSDIDLLVEFLPGAEVDLVEHLAAERELSELLGRKVDLVSKRALRDALREEVLSQACHIYAA